MSKIITDAKKINEVLSRGVEEVIVADELRKKMMSGKQLRIKLGIDPTSPNIHLGRSIPLLKLRDFQELGHKIVFIIGDFTGVIGDTSDKDSERPMLAPAKVKENMKDYLVQAGKIIDIKKCEFHYNSEWLGKLGYNKIGEQADQFSLAEFIARENIQKRLEAGTRVSLRELLYPLMQGYDSVFIKADVEVGGTDQRFNLLAGRKLQERYGQKPQDIIMGPLLEGTDGRKMSSSWGNTINITAEPNDMFGKVMSIGDNLIAKYFTLATRIPLDEAKKIVAGNPRDAKMRLAKEIVSLYHGKKAAKAAEANFIKVFQKHEAPDEVKSYKLGLPAGKAGVKSINIIDLLVKTGLVKSKSEGRRVIEEGGVKVDNEIIKDATREIKLSNKDILVQKGKRNFVKVKI